MIKVAMAINSFASKAEPNVFVPPEEPIFVLTGSQLQDIISKAIQPLQDHVDALEATVANLESKVSALEATQDTQAENEFNMLRLINDLRKKVPGKLEISRAEKIEKYLQARPDHKASFETLKGHLGVDKARLNEAIKTLMNASPGRYGITRTPGDKRKRCLVMLPK
jgi:sugar-specific transcriptional regulator TrmB